MEKNRSDWLDIDPTLITKKGGSFLTSLYDNNVLKALIKIYPQVNWHLIYLRKRKGTNYHSIGGDPRYQTVVDTKLDFWNSVYYQRKYLDGLANKLEYQVRYLTLSHDLFVQQRWLVLYLYNVIVILLICWLSFYHITIILISNTTIGIQSRKIIFWISPEGNRWCYIIGMRVSRCDMVLIIDWATVRCGMITSQK